MFLTAPIVGRLMLRVDMRLIIATGLIIFAPGSYQMTWITRDYDFYELLLPQILRGVGMMLAMVPTNTIALGTLPPDRVKNASGLFNLTRNSRRRGRAGCHQPGPERTHRSAYRPAAREGTWGNATATETLNQFAQRLQGMGDAALMAMKQLSQIVHRQAVVMGYGDAFFMLTLFYIWSAQLIVLLLKKPASAATEPSTLMHSAKSSGRCWENSVAGGHRRRRRNRISRLKGNLDGSNISGLATAHGRQDGRGRRCIR